MTTPDLPGPEERLRIGTGLIMALMTTSAGPADPHGGVTGSEHSPATRTSPSAVREEELLLCPTHGGDLLYTETGRQLPISVLWTCLEGGLAGETDLVRGAGEISTP